MKKGNAKKHLWEYERLPSIECSERPSVLVIGNGINRMFDAPSWEDLICNALSRNKSFYTYEDIKDMPANMQIVVASAGKLGGRQPKGSGLTKEVQKIASQLCVKTISSEYRDILDRILSLPVDMLLTTNYSNEFELFATGKSSTYQVRKCQRRTKQVKGIEEQFRLFQYTTLGENYPQRPLWHIHGDISRPSSMVIGHYYYGKLLKQIEERVVAFIREFKRAEQKGEYYTPKSWVDYFLIGDVYFLGFGMNLAEQDLWWLLACKQENFPESKVYFYQAEKHMDKSIKKLLIAYGAELVTDIPVLRENYQKYYSDAVDDIRGKMCAGGTYHV